MIGSQIIALEFSIPALLVIALDGVLPALMRRPRRTPPLSGPEVILLVEMAAALGWFVWTFHGSHDARQMASFGPLVIGSHLQIAFRYRQSGQTPSYVLPTTALLFSIGIVLIMQNAALESIGAVVMVAAVAWDVITFIRASRRPTNQSII